MVSYVYTSCLLFVKLNCNVVPSAEADPGMEGMLIGQGKADDNPVGQKPEEPEEYDADEQAVGGVQQSKQAENIGMCVLLRL